MYKTKPVLTEKDIQEFVKTLLRDSDERIQLMYGRNVKLFDKPRTKQFLINYLKNQNISANQLKITPSALNRFNKGIAIGTAYAHYAHTTKGKISIEQFMLQNLGQLFSLSSDSLLIGTKFTSFRKYFMKVIPSNMRKERIHRINTFLKAINKKEFYAMGQQMTDLNLRVRKLHKAGKPITIRVVDQHKDIYDLCCSCIETYLKILYGIKKAYDDAPLSYNSIKKTSIYTIKKKLENSDHNYQLLLRPFSTIIWNADKHIGTLKNPSKKRIEFIANEGKKRKSYSSFIQLTKELCAVTFLLSRYSQGILLKIAKKRLVNETGLVNTT